MKRALALVTLITVAALPAIAADSYTLDLSHSEVTFKIRHLMSRVSGEFGAFDAKVVADFENLEASSVELTIDASSIDTRNADRDKHLRAEDFFFVEKHPEITFKSSKIKRADGDTFHVQGTLTMRGVAKEVTLPVTYLGEMADPWGNTKAGFTISTTLDRKDFGIVWNRALDAGGVILGDEVEVEINLQLAKK